MKKLLSFFLITLYLGASIGIPLQQHFCQGEMQSEALLSAEEDCCCGGEEGMPDCCEDKIFNLKVDLEPSLKSIPNFQFSSPFLALFNSTNLNLFEKDQEEIYLGVIQNKAPPPIPLYIRHGALIFYA